MEIKSIFDASKLYQKNNAINKPTSNSTQNPETNTSVAATTDTVSFSSEASFKSNLNSVMKDYAIQSKVTESVNHSKVDELKLKYSGDNCPVSGTEIADAMINKICGHKL